MLVYITAVLTTVIVSIFHGSIVAVWASEPSATQTCQRITAQKDLDQASYVILRRIKLSSKRYGDPYTYMVLFADGSVYDSLPKQGLNNVTLEQLRLKSPDYYFAKYKETPDGLELSWLDGRTTTLTPNVEQLLPACNQVILDGVYKRSPDERPSLVFSQDGTFVDTGILSRIDEDYVAEDSFPKGVGVYQINNHSLILKYNHGYMTQLSFFVTVEESDKRSPQTIYINTFSLEKVTLRR